MSSQMDRREALIRLGVTGAAFAACATLARRRWDQGGFQIAAKQGDRQVRDFQLKNPGAELPQIAVARLAEGPAALTRAAVEAMGGMKRFISRGDIVVVKPNIGWDRTPLHAANSNPEVVAAVVEMAYEAGAKTVVVTDASCNDPSRCFQRSGIWRAAHAKGAEVILPSEHRFRGMRLKGEVLDDWPVYVPLIQADKLINVPVAKHHNLAKYTGAMKNWYGSLGGRRNRLHQSIDLSVADLATFMRPTLTVLDATRVLIRNGPQGGNIDDTRVLNQVVASIDQVAIDAYGCTLIGQKRENIPYLRMGEERGLGTSQWEQLRMREVLAMPCKSDCGCAHKGDKAPSLDPSLTAPKPPAFTPTMGDFPAPIPWLGQVGAVAAIDAVAASPQPLAVAAASRQPPAGAVASRQLPAASVGAAASPDRLSTSPEAVREAARLQGEMSRREGARMSALGEQLGLGTPAEQASAAAEAPAPGAGKVKPKKIDPSRPGSGIPARPLIRALVWARRASQAGFLGLFLYFLFQTAFRGSFGAKAGDAVRLPLPVEAFLLADPFVGAMTLLSTHTVYRGLLWSVAMLALTMVFGRVFCGWICPFGTLHHLTAWLFPSRVGRGASRVEANKTHSWQRAKYYLLYAFLLAAVAGSAIGGLFDPICVAVRAIGLGVIPAAQYIVGHLTGAAIESNNQTFQLVGDRSADFFAAHVWNAKQFYFHQTWFISFLLIAILFMNRFIPRFWCRALCPLGAFLGVFSRFSLFGMEKDHARCTDCNLCLVHCQGADSPQGGVKHRQDECHMCLNCENACPEDVIKFRFLPGLRSTIRKPDVDRRTALAAAAAGAVAIPAARIADSLDANYHPRVIRPPGSVEERDFLERCIRCAECMKVCPNNALHPAFFEAGIEGIWTPILIPRIGYCEHSCVLCGQVCPTGAIQKITEKEKQGIGQPPIRIGTAFYDHGRCLPWSMSTPCIVCEEFCPTSPKAIWVEEADIPKRSEKPGADGHEPEMLTVHVQRPHVDPSLCIGCGACEKVCPVQDQPAVYVTNVGETRSRTNVILLEGESYNRT